MSERWWTGEGSSWTIASCRQTPAGNWSLTSGNQHPPTHTHMYPHVTRRTWKYLEVPGSTWKYLHVPSSWHVAPFQLRTLSLAANTAEQADTRERFDQGTGRWMMATPVANKVAAHWLTGRETYGKWSWLLVSWKQMRDRGQVGAPRPNWVVTNSWQGGRWVSAGPSGAAEKNFGTNVVVHFANHLKFFHRHSGTSLLDVSAFWKS